LSVSEPTEADVLELAILRVGEGWRVFSEGGGWGRFSFRVDAEEAALRLVAKMQAAGRPAIVLVQDEVGELRILSA
jgi:hypothetical protein